MSERRERTDFLIKEYEWCGDYIKFHYDQRDKSQRFFFTFVFGGIGLVVTLAKIDQLSQQIYLLLLILPLVFLGFFTLNQIIRIRCTTTIYHKAIVTIRAQLIGPYTTSLWLQEDSVRYYTHGFNFFTVLIIMTITASVAASGVFIVLSEFNYATWFSVILSVSTIFLIGVPGQVWWYRRALKPLDRLSESQVIDGEKN